VTAEPVTRLEAVKELLAIASSRQDARMGRLVDRVDEISDQLEHAVRLTVRAMDKGTGPVAKIRIQFDAGSELHQALIGALTASIGGAAARREETGELADDGATMLAMLAALSMPPVAGDDVDGALDRAEKLLAKAGARHRRF
jgi:hypothetical protein